MKLVSLAFRGVRGLPQRDIDLSAAVAAGRPFLVTGSAGSGKTTLLEAIAAAKEADKAYQRSLGNIPAQKSTDPWGTVRSDDAPKAATKTASPKPKAAKNDTKPDGAARQ